jgi:putative NADPH-quinone reductase
VLLSQCGGRGFDPLVKGFFEQVVRPGFAYDLGGKQVWAGRLRGKTARVVVTMGMPASVHQAGPLDVAWARGKREREAQVRLVGEARTTRFRSALSSV